MYDEDYRSQELPQDQSAPVSDLKGNKDDQGKVRYDLLPADALDQVARVLTYGAKKYGERHWERGIEYSRFYRAAMGCLLAWWRGEELVEESGLPHLAHAACSILLLLALRTRARGSVNDPLDNRPQFEFPPR